jgi:hypothetical protein
MRTATMALAAAIALVAGGLMTAPAAYAGDLVAVQCAGSDTITYNPGLRNFTQTDTLTALPAGSSCTGPGMISGDDSFTGPFTYTLSLSCQSLALFGTATNTFTWSPSGDTSTWADTVVSNTWEDGEFISTNTGPITAGDYAGATLTDVEVIPTTELTACDSAPGLTQVTGTATWTFSGL